jgi:hypothetical protein
MNLKKPCFQIQIVFMTESSEQAVPHTTTFPQSTDGALLQPELSLLNRYECLILQDEDSVVDDPLLKKTPYIVNVRYSTLICIECKHSVDPDQASSHARRLHSYCKIAPGFATEIKRKYSGLKAEKISAGQGSAIKSVGNDSNLSITHGDLIILVRFLRQKGRPLCAL